MIEFFIISFLSVFWYWTFKQCTDGKMETQVCFFTLVVLFMYMYMDVSESMFYIPPKLLCFMTHEYDALWCFFFFFDSINTLYRLHLHLAGTVWNLQFPEFIWQSFLISIELLTI